MTKIISITAKRKDEDMSPFPAAPPMPWGATPPYRGFLMKVMIEIECGSEDISNILRRMGEPVE